MVAPEVTVLLPAYEAEATIGIAMRSVLAQSFRDFELVVIDDGSRDGTARVVSSVADARVRFIRGERNEGLAARLNQGIDAARGRFIARMDADDVAYPDRLERQHRFLAGRAEVDLVGSRAIVFREAGQPLGLLPFRESHEALCSRPWNGIPLPHPTWFGRTGWFRRFRYAIPEFVRAEDQELLLRACPESRYACLPEVLLGYRRAPFSASRVAKARRSQLRALWLYALRRRRPDVALMAALAWGAKRSVDVLASSTRGRVAHPGGGGGEVSGAEGARWLALWGSLQEPRR